MNKTAAKAAGTFKNNIARNPQTIAMRKIARKSLTKSSRALVGFHKMKTLMGHTLSSALSAYKDCSKRLCVLNPIEATSAWSVQRNGIVYQESELIVAQENWREGYSAVSASGA
jgi:hypothetical protein